MVTVTYQFSYYRLYYSYLLVQFAIAPAIFQPRTKKKFCRDPGSNQGPLDLQSNALPTELSRLPALASTTWVVYPWTNMYNAHICTYTIKHLDRQIFTRYQLFCSDNQPVKCYMYTSKFWESMWVNAHVKILSFKFSVVSFIPEMGHSKALYSQFW